MIEDWDEEAFQARYPRYSKYASFANAIEDLLARMEKLESMLRSPELYERREDGVYLKQDGSKKL